MASSSPPTIAVPKPSTCSRSVIAAVMPSSAAFTTSRNNPSVTSTNGSDNSRRTGPTTALTSAKSRAIHSQVPGSPSGPSGLGTTVMPPSTWATPQKTAAMRTTLTRNLSTRSTLVALPASTLCVGPSTGV